MNKLITIFLLSAILFGCNKNKTPKPDSSGMFVKFFGGAFDDNGFSIAPSGDGGFFVAGSTIQPNRTDTNILVVKIDQNGNKVWDRKYTFDDNYDEVARDILVDSDGNLLVAGYKRSERSQNTDILIMKIYKDSPDHFDTTTFGDNLLDDKAYNITQDADKDFILYGSTGSSSADLDLFITKIHINKSIPLANQVWKRQMGAFSQNDLVGSLKTTGSNDLIFCGSTYRTDNASSMMLALSDDYGNLLWNYRFNENDHINQFGYDMANLMDGYIVAGSINRTTDPNSTKDIFLVRTNLDGKANLPGNKIIIPGSGSQEAFSIIAIDNSVFLITGYTTAANGKKDIYVAKVDDKGNVLASKTFGGDYNDVGYKILKTPDNGYLIVGTVEVVNNTMMAAYKLNSQLELVP